MKPASSIRAIARRFVAERRMDNGAVALRTAELVRLLGDVARSAHLWLGVDEGAPREGQRVLFYSASTGEIYVGSRWGDSWFDDQDAFPCGQRVEILGVTHWMQFPRKPHGDC